MRIRSGAITPQKTQPEHTKTNIPPVPESTLGWYSRENHISPARDRCQFRSSAVPTTHPDFEARTARTDNIHTPPIFNPHRAAAPVAINRTKMARALMTPDDILRMPECRQICLCRTSIALSTVGSDVVGRPPLIQMRITRENDVGLSGVSDPDILARAAREERVLDPRRQNHDSIRDSPGRIGRTDDGASAV